MSCPRCGFPDIESPCTLCGQDDFNAFELARFNSEKQDRFDLTLIVPEHNFSKPLLDLLQQQKIPHRQTSEAQSRYFILIGTRHLPDLERCLHLASSPVTLMVNGRYRPFIHELWLPLLRMSEAS